MSHDLSRFLEVQENSYAFAKEALIQGRKRSHWMWYIFPQIKGQGHSQISKYYAIASVEEAIAYVSHSVLGSRLRELTHKV